MRKKYIKKADRTIVAVQLNLESSGFKYQKWGAEQQCKKGDWVVDNSGETYTIDNEVFQKTYRKVDDGKYVKTTPVWAEVATGSGNVTTKEGKSHYNAGDYLVYNNEDDTDAYCMSAEKFESMYESAD